MLNKIYIAVPFFVGLSAIAFSTANAVRKNKETELFGYDKFILCSVSGDNCTSIKKHQKIPIKTNPPLGLDTAVNKAEINCLARNITQEAVKGYLVDKIHVAWGTINRVKIGRGYGRTICEVISQSNQMSWYKDSAKRNAPPRKEDVDIAKEVLKGNIPNPSPDCMITNWYNIKFDSKNSFNAKQKDRIDVCSKHPRNTPHFYMEVRL
jgi:spore germination cell wall hydrolase CwlJ-like protein